MTLTEFLLARIADKEKAAGRMIVKTSGDPVLRGLVYHSDGRVTDAYKRDVTDEYARWAKQHEQVSDPVGLAECKALRAILSLHSTNEHHGNDPIHHPRPVRYFCDCQDMDGIIMGEEPCDEKRILGAIYANHPDYQQEWKP